MQESARFDTRDLQSIAMPSVWILMTLLATPGVSAQPQPGIEGGRLAYEAHPSGQPSAVFLCQ